MNLLIDKTRLRVKKTKAKYLYSHLYDLLLHISARSVSERSFLSEPEHPTRPAVPVYTLVHQYRAVCHQCHLVNPLLLDGVQRHPPFTVLTVSQPISTVLASAHAGISPAGRVPKIPESSLRFAAGASTGSLSFSIQPQISAIQFHQSTALYFAHTHCFFVRLVIM